jgi:hypothetical protein
MAKDQRVYRVINPLFLEGKQGFISKETGNQDFREDLTFQKGFKVPLGSSGSSGTKGGITEALGARDVSSTGTTGAEGATTGSKDDGEVNAGVESSQIQQPPRIQVVIPRYKPSDQEAPNPT